MDSRKDKGSIDEMSLVKSASWTWHQQGSEAEAKVPMHHFVLSTAHQTPPRPSRYKREAIGKSESHKQKENNLHVSPLLMTPMSSDHYDISLLDAYDVQRISRKLDFYIESTRADYYKRTFDACDKKVGGKVVDFPLENGRILEKTLKGKNENLKGFWVVACGSRNDVVEGRRSNVAGCSRCPEKEGVVVTSSGCRPRR